MSYILDALKRADAERGRGTVPGLHAQPLPGNAPADSVPRARWLWPVAAIVLVLGGLAALAWVWRGQAGGERATVVAAAPVAAPATPRPAAAAQPAGPPVDAPAPQAPPPAPPPQPPARAPVTSVAPAPAHDPGQTPILQSLPSGPGLLIPGPAVNLPPMTAPYEQPVLPAQPTPAAAASTRPATPPLEPAAATPAQAVPRATRQAAASPTRGASAIQPAAPASAAIAPNPGTSATQAAGAAAPLIAELPEEVRRLIPALAITGAVYSENPAQRLLLVNGQVLPQGATAAPEVMIEEIRSRSATFTFRGTRFRVTY